MESTLQPVLNLTSLQPELPMLQTLIQIWLCGNFLRVTSDGVKLKICEIKDETVRK